MPYCEMSLKIDRKNLENCCVFCEFMPYKFRNTQTFTLKLAVLSSHKGNFGKNTIIR